MKKVVSVLLSVVLAVACCFCMVACKKADEDSVAPYNGIKQMAKTQIKAGLICLHDENSTYDKNFIDAFKAACEANGVTYLIKTGIPEGTECYDAAAELVDQGCNYVFADSFGHEAYLLQAANEFPDVQFCHATGTTAHTATRGNFHNAFASIYEGRYLAGYAAGLKLNTMTDKAVNNKFTVGYVGAFTYAEVISGYTSWFLGLEAALTEGYTAEMKVQFTGSWYDPTAEKTAAETLINDYKCVLISQHADSMGAPNACETAGVPNVSYNGSTAAECPNTFIVSSKIDWAPYFNYCFDSIAAGEEIEYDWTGTIENGAVKLTEFGAAAATGTAAAIEAVKLELNAGLRKVFDVKNFTVGGKTLKSYRADVDTDDAFTPDTQVVFADSNAPTAPVYFHESATGFRSAPYFDINIDGITLLNTKL